VISDFLPPVREDLVGVAPYGAPQDEGLICLNVNENPFPLPSDVVDALAEATRRVARDLNRYPDRDAIELRARLARYLATESSAFVDPNSVWAANGSNEVMHHILIAFGGPGRTALSFPPSYSMYPEYARDTFTRLISIPRTSEFRIDLPRAENEIADRRPVMTLVASPNNPTGTGISLGDLATLARATLTVNGILVIDEAYAEFRHHGVPSALELLSDYPNVIVTRTMSKAFGFAGARLGYAAAGHPGIVEALRIVRLPYHLSAITQAVACAALDHADVLQAQVELIRSERDRLDTSLRTAGYDVIPSEANFLMFGRFDDTAGVWQAIRDRGILIRQVGPEGWLRVSGGTPKENDRFLMTLHEADGMRRER
jgi:histidinol-phosphate aminotransferase